MSHFVKYKRIVFLLAGLWLSISASAQEARSSSVSSFKQFINENGGDQYSSAYYIACVPKASVQQFSRESSVTIERQLSDSVFIFSYKQFPTPSAFNFPYRWVQKANADWKMSPSLLLQKNKQTILWPGKFIISVRNPDRFIKSGQPQERLQKTASSNTFIASVDNANDFNELLNDQQVFFLGTYQSPKEELQINDLDLSANRISLLHSRHPALDGSGISISIKENSPDTADIDYAARYIPTPLASTTVTDHATVMATMAAGAGNSWYLGKGVAPGASLSSSNFANLLPDADSSYRQYHISVQNHSYGVGIENFYGADAAAFDSSALRNDSLLFVFSAGNSGNLTATSGNYAGMPKRDNLTGSFKMAKNIITVGAVDSFGRIAATSSRGPAFDGRIKPELVAYGEDGSSGAAALVSGTAAVLQQVYKNANGSLPPSGLVKAVLLNSARDVGAPGIDFVSGYGNLDANEAALTLSKDQYFSGEATYQSEQAFDLEIPAQVGKIKITLAWQDAPAEANAYRALVNDLDIDLQLSASGQSWKPWVLNSSPQADSLDALPTRGRDSLNNVEQITLDNPVAGKYKILVRGFSVSSLKQPFFIAYQVDTANYFSWVFPASADNIFPAATNLVRFSTDINSTDARLLYSIDKGNNWILIDSLINTANPYLYWRAPDTAALAVLKMEVAGRRFTSDTFTLSRKLDFKLGFNCQDSLLWYWDKLPGIGTYQLYALAGRSLQPVAIIADTQFILTKSMLNARYFAVAPVIGDKTGVKSYTTDYTSQGVDCYITNFIADLVNEQANIQLQLGTGYLVKTVQFEKWRQNEFVALQPSITVSGLNYQAVDNQLQKGANTYRAKISLSDGRIIYAEPTSLFYFDKADVVIYPNPILQNTQLTIQFRELQNQLVNIYDISGRIIFTKQISNTTEKIQFNFPKGIYLIVVNNPGSRQKEVFKLITY